MVVASIRLAGAVLVSALCVIPAATGRFVGRSLSGVVGWAIAAGVGGVALGFVGGHALDWPEGAAIVLALAMLLLAAFGARRLRG